MKNNKAMTKLTPAQAYAAQVKADRRAAAVERQGATVRNDNARINEMFNLSETVKETTKKTVTRELWSDDEIDLLVQLYLLVVTSPETKNEWVDIWPIFNKRFPERTEGAFRMHGSIIKAYDGLVPHQGLPSGSRSLKAKLYAADPVRFAAAA